MPKPEPFHPDVRAARWFPRAGVSRRTLRLFRKPPRPRASTADVDVSTAGSSGPQAVSSRTGSTGRVLQAAPVQRCFGSMAAGS